MIHFYYGDNSFAINQHVALVKEQFVKKYGIDNVTTLECSDTQKVLTEIVNVGLFSINRLLILKDVFSNKDLTEKLPDTLSLAQSDTEIMVIDLKPDKRKKLYKVLLAGKSREFILPKDLTQFVIDEAARQKVVVNKNAISDLITYTSGDVWRISNEVAKFKMMNADISEENIKKYVEPDLTTNVFHILDDVFNHETEQAIEKIRVLRQNDDPYSFFNLLASQIFVLSVANSSSKPSNVVAKEMGLHPYVVSKMSQISKRLAVDRIAKVAKAVAEADAKIKLSNKEEAWDIVELVVRKI